MVADIVRDDGAIVYLNGIEIHRSNMPAGEINYQTTALTPADRDGPIYEIIPTRFAISPDLLKVGENIITAEIHQANTGSSDLGFQFSLKGLNNLPGDFIIDMLNKQGGEQLLKDSINLMPSQLRSSAKTALDLAFYTKNSINLSNINTQDLSIAIRLLRKLDLKNKIAEIVDLKLSTLDKSLVSLNWEEIEFFEKEMQLLPNDSIGFQKIKQIIATPPKRKKDTPKQLIDLSDHYNASMHHYAGWWGANERDDLRTLPDQYDQQQNTPFDLRGIIQLNSGPNNSGETVNDNRWLKLNNNNYPDSVNGIKIDSKANRINLLTGLLFGHAVQKGLKAATIIVNYEDNSNEEFSLIAKVDVFDYWVHTPDRMNQITAMDENKIGWIGTSSNGEKRALTKFTWNNPSS